MSTDTELDTAQYWRRGQYGHYHNRSLEARHWRVANGRGAALLRRFPSGRPIMGVELGVFSGMLSAHLLEQRRDLFLIMVDAWRTNKWLSRAMSNTEFAIVRRHIMHTRTTRAANMIPDGILDFVFVDAGHDYKSVCQDIAAWTSKLRPGGMLCGHDIHEDGVRQAVDEMVGDYDTDCDDTWFRKGTDAI